MSFQIESAGNKSYGLIINKNGQALVSSTQIPVLTEAAELGNSYYLSSGFVSVTAAQTDSAIIYIENTFNKDVRLDILRTCGTQIQKWTCLHSVATGTIVSDNSGSFINNIKLGSGNIFPAKSLKATAGGKTFTDGNLFSQWINPVGQSTQVLDGAVIISPGKSLGFKVDVLSDADVCITILAHICD
jgi:hypothetical protein